MTAAKWYFLGAQTASTVILFLMIEPKYVFWAIPVIFVSNIANYIEGRHDQEKLMRGYND